MSFIVPVLGAGDEKGGGDIPRSGGHRRLAMLRRKKIGITDFSTTKEQPELGCIRFEKNPNYDCIILNNFIRRCFRPII
jgi:hypothetical protein